MASAEDTEITLGVGKLLGLFFLLAAICGVFFSIGYALGKTSGREQAANDQVQVSSPAETAPSSNSTSSGEKPSAAITASSSTAATSEPATAGDPQTQLTFYKAVQQSGSGSQTGDAAAAASPTAKPVTAEVKPEPTPSVSATLKSAGPEVISHTSPVTGPGTIVVQIAALSREDDAVALAGALRKKDYNVFVVNNPVNNDKFYHVQVGPFSNLADAQAMKAKLVAEGYNPIIKR